MEGKFADADDADGDDMSSQGRTACEKASRGGVASCEVSCDWRFQPNTLLKVEGLKLAEASFCEKQKWKKRHGYEK